MTAKFIIAQILGIVSLIIGVGMFFLKKKPLFICGSFLINFVLGVEYLLLNSYTAACLCLFAAVRYLIYLQKGKNKFFSSVWIPIFFVIANILISIFTYQIWYDILPSISAVTVCIYPWFDNVKVLKIGTLCIAPLWIVYDILVYAWASLVMEIVCLVVELVIFILMEIKERAEARKEFEICEENKYIV
ncbi:MAG: YgjV family protein [Clostridia bacterium]|nr:YgjV family protein [Clostridia bacterium]